MYALIISSLYPDTIDDHDMLNAEVETDSKTVKSMFKDNKELIVPAGKISHADQDKIKSDLINIIKDNQKTEVCIILNTHGSPGSYDLDVNLILEVIKLLSLKNIRIVSMFALMCDGFSKSNCSTQRRYSSFPEVKSPPKPSGMEALQKKLIHLETDYPQLFHIKGFDYAYDPVKDLGMIKSLIQDENIGQSLYVMTKKSKEEDYEYLQRCISLCRMHENTQPIEEYNKATNKLGRVLNKMKQNICAYLKGHEELNIRSEALLQAVLKELQINNDIPSVRFFEMGYLAWLKAHKMSSNERLEVLEAYCAPQIKKNELLISPPYDGIQPKSPRLFQPLQTSTPSINEKANSNFSQNNYG